MILISSHRIITLGVISQSARRVPMRNGVKRGCRIATVARSRTAFTRTKYHEFADGGHAHYDVHNGACLCHWHSRDDGGV